MRTWWASWTSQIGKGRAANLALLALTTVTTRQRTRNGKKTTVTRTSSGCDVTLSFLVLSIQSELFSLSECLHNSNSEMPTTHRRQKPFLSLGIYFYWAAPSFGLHRLSPVHRPHIIFI